MSKVFKVIAIIFLSLIVFAGALFFSYLIITRNAKLDENKLISTDRYVVLCDDNGNEIVNASVKGKRKSIEIKNLKDYTLNAFIASEDRTFYKHNGLNYKRMLKALYKNVTSGGFKEGASTISQQLIKNTHLSGDKTISRKLNEIRLTKALEKRFEKDDILEMYLNTIYFGHNCYGLESASEFYFDKNAEELTLDESAVLVGLLTSPNNYSPFKNEEKCLLRRNTVLKAMLKCGFISESEFIESINKPINAVKGSTNDKYSDYVNAVFDELEEIDIDFYGLSDGCRVNTYMQPELQNFIENIEYESDNATIITSNSGGVNAFKSTIGNLKRQPGSTIKPIFVYGPSINEKLISPFTKINDEKIDYAGYSPENYDKQYHGYVSVAESIKNSYNVPAVKTLNMLTIDKAEKYMTKMNMKLEDDEKNLSVALGGMKYGMTLKEIADCYTTFANGGKFAPSKFVKTIIDKNGKIIYENNCIPNRVYSEGTCSLMNEMLIETSKSGTAKKLKDLNFDVATKTGTCGNEEGNTDAYSVSYTSEHCLAIWLGDKNNERNSITGGNQCCNILKKILNDLYSTHTPKNLEKDLGTTTVDIDLEEYTNNNRILLADPISPKLNILKVKALKDNIPTENSTKFSNPTITLPQIIVENGQAKIKLCQTKYYAYLINRTKNGKNEQIYDGKWIDEVSDAPDDGVYVYTVTPYYFDGINKHFGTTITLPSVNLTKDGGIVQDTPPDIVYKDWFNL